MKIFFTGCTHFDHENIIKLAKRPFDNIDQMNDELVYRWNQKVRPTDRVYHLGDFSWTHTLRWNERLNGQKILIIGNHDKEGLLAGVRGGFDQVYRYHEIATAGTRFVLFHYPIDDWNGRWKGSIHLHCHTHSSEFRNPNLPPVSSDLDLPNNFPPEIKCNRFNVGVDACDFAPVSLDEILNGVFE